MNKTFILILIIVGGGGSGPRPAASIDSIEFDSEKACLQALRKATSKNLPNVGPRFSVTGFCTEK